MAQELLEFRARSSTGFSLVAVGVIALVAGCLQPNAGVLAFAVILLAGPTGLYFVTRRSLRGLQLNRIAPPTAFEEEAVEIAVEIENNSRFPVFFPEVLEIFPPEIHSQKELLYAGRLQPEEKVCRTYRGYCLLPRGLYKVGPTAVRVTDPFGWFELKKYFGTRHSLKIYPKVHRFGIEERIGRAVTHALMAETRSVRGESTEFLSVREYRTGDSPRRIHWGLSAHRGFPVVREFARPSTGDLTIFLDLSLPALVGLGRNSSTEHAVKIAAAVSAQAVRLGRRVQLVAGDHPSNTVPAGNGAAQLTRILDVLVEIRPTELESPLPELLSRQARRLRRGTTLLLMISPYLFDDEHTGSTLAGLLSGWQRQGHRMVAVVFDEATFPRLREFRRRTTEDDSRTRAFVRRLEAQGIETYTIPCGADLEATFAGITP